MMMFSVLFFITLSSVMGFISRIRATGFANQAFVNARGEASAIGSLKMVSLCEPHLL
jgi:hypothetical protein